MFDAKRLQLMADLPRQLRHCSSYRWRQKYGGMAPEVAKELKALQKENARLKKLVAD